jgi:hypothetical protein
VAAVVGLRLLVQVAQVAVETVARLYQTQLPVLLTPEAEAAVVAVAAEMAATAVLASSSSNTPSPSNLS